MINCMTCTHAKPFAGPDSRIDFSKKICKEGPPTPVIVGVDPNRHPVVQYLQPLVNKDFVCDRHEPFDAAKAEGPKTQ